MSTSTNTNSELLLVPLLILLPVLIVILVSGYENQAATDKGPLGITTIPGEENGKEEEWGGSEQEQKVHGTAMPIDDAILQFINDIQLRFFPEAVP